MKTILEYMTYSAFSMLDLFLRYFLPALGLSLGLATTGRILGWC